MSMLPTAASIFEIFEDNAASKPPQKSNLALESKYMTSINFLIFFVCNRRMRLIMINWPACFSPLLGLLIHSPKEGLQWTG